MVILYQNKEKKQGEKYSARSEGFDDIRPFGYGGKTLGACG
jgi:hypothetical protein